MTSRFNVLMQNKNILSILLCILLCKKGFYFLFYFVKYNSQGRTKSKQNFPEKEQISYGIKLVISSVETWDRNSAVKLFKYMIYYSVYIYVYT